MNTSFDPDAAARADSGIYGLPHTVEEARVVVLPVPFAATTSYGGGAQEGPAAVLAASRQVDLFDVETGRAYAQGIAMAPEPDDVRAWDREARALAEGWREAALDGPVVPLARPSRNPRRGTAGGALEQILTLMRALPAPEAQA